MNYLDEINRRGVLPALGGAGGQCIEQNPNELAAFCEWLEDLNVKTYLEVGVSQGGLFRFMVDFMGLNGCGVDLNQPVHYPDTVGWKFWRGDCRKQLAIIKGIKAESPFDLVFIDASHDYEGVAKDAEIYGPMAGKVLAFHDIAGLRECQGSAKHWQETKNSPKNYKRKGSDGAIYYPRPVEFIDPDNPVGIGAVIL